MYEHVMERINDFMNQDAERWFTYFILADASALFATCNL